MKKLSFLLLIAAWGTTFGITQINISPKGSDSAGDGSAAKPFGSLERACKAVENSADKEFEIIVNAGEYFFDKGISLGEKEFKGKKISIVGKPDAKGKPRFIGGKKISAKELSKVTDQSILSKLPKEAEGTLYSIDLKKHGISDYGKMCQRGFGSSNKTLQMEAFIDGKPLKLAQYPNVDSTRLPIGEIIDAGYRRSIAAGQGAFKPKLDNNVRGATFTYEFDRPERWLNAPDAYISGYPSAGWAYDEIKIKKIDTDKKTITLESPHQYGVYSNGKQVFEKGDPAASVAGFDRCMRGYKVINLLEEIDANGEYYIDRDTGVFYIMLDKKPADSTPIYFSMLETPFIQMNKVANVKIDNIDFSSSRSHAVKANDSSNITVSNCDVHGCARAVAIQGKEASRNNKISHCRFYDIAYDVVSMSGGNRKTLEPSNSSIEDCEFFDNARVIPCCNSAVNISGVGIKFGNCEIRNHPHVTVGHSGNDLILERNIFTNCGRDGSDMGIMYTGRNQTTQGNVIRHNFFSQNLAPHPDAMLCGVYVDDGSAGQLIENNVFCRTGNMGHAPAFGAIYIHGGCDNIGRRNVFIECQSGMSQQEWTDEKYGAALKREANKFYKEVDANSELYKKRYPKLEKQLTAEYPRVNYVEECRVYNSSVTMSGKIHLKRNRVLKLREGVSPADVAKISEWTIDDVLRCFADDYVVKGALSGKIGIRK